MESLPIDEAHKIAGLRVNTWLSMIVFVAAGAFAEATNGTGCGVDHPHIVPL